MIEFRTDIIKTKLKVIEENVDLVRENLPDDFSDFKELGLIKDGIYKRIESSIQEVLSICAIINADLKLGIPSNRDDIINILIEKKKVSKKLGKKIKELKGFRNFLVYRYEKIDDKIAFDNIKQGISDFKWFNDDILDFLNSLNSE